jgi:hypothetical protein
LTIAATVDGYAVALLAVPCDMAEREAGGDQPGLNADLEYFGFISRPMRLTI